MPEEPQKKDGSNADNQKKISLPEIVIMVLIVLFADFFDVFSDFLMVVPGLQVLLGFNWLMDIGVTFLISFWLLMKGGIGFKKQITAFIGNLIEWIPGLDILPIRSVTLIIAIYLINNGKVESKGISRQEALRHAGGGIAENAVSSLKERAIRTATGGYAGSAALRVGQRLVRRDWKGATGAVADAGLGDGDG